MATIKFSALPTRTAAQIAGATSVGIPFVADGVNYAATPAAIVEAGGGTALVMRARKVVSTATYTLLDADYDKRLLFTHASGCDVTIPPGLTAGRTYAMFGTLGAITLIEGASMALSANALFFDGIADILSDGALAPIEVYIDASAVGYVFGQMATV